MTRETATDSRGYLPRAPAVRDTTRDQWAEQHADRPAECICHPDDDLVCFPCYRAGFRRVNPNGTGLGGADA